MATEMAPHEILATVTGMIIVYVITAELLKRTGGK